MKKDPDKKLKELNSQIRKVKKQIAYEKLESLAGFAQALIDGELDQIQNHDTEQLREIHKSLSILFGSGQNAS